jgi:uncharacterized protein YkwD
LLRIQVSLIAASSLLFASLLPSQPSAPTSAFNETSINGAVEAGIVPEEDGTVVAASVSSSGLELALFEVTNAERARAGLEPLVFSDTVLGVARERAAAQVGAPSLSHFNAAGQLAFTQLLRDSGLSFDLAGENLARVSGPTASAADRADFYLMQSATHRNNILDGRYTAMAVGSAVDPNGNIVFAQIFHTDF